ncbi:hypothetical protein SCUCBS95973_007883 [Sporothrix curviconia]|uniref:Uncharacterized protein n=1 Tax=Sporothrix curviconia TaxID=1260050 RepID=A0ABP0CH16_9PEZI
MKALGCVEEGSHVARANPLSPNWMNNSVVTRHLGLQPFQEFETPYTPYISLFGSNDRAVAHARHLKDVFGAEEVDIVTITTENLVAYDESQETDLLSTYEDEDGQTQNVPPVVVWINQGRYNEMQQAHSASRTYCLDRYMSVREARENLMTDIPDADQHMGDWLAVNYIHRSDVRETRRYN